MTRILQIPNYQYPNIGGIEQTSRDISNILSKMENVEHKTICFNENAQDGDYICRRNETKIDIVDDYEVIRCGCIAKIASQSISLTYPRELKKVLINFNPDIVIFHFPNPYVASFLLPLLPQKWKLIVYWHLDIVKQKLLGKLFKGQTERLCKRANKIVATSPNYVEGSYFLSKYKDKVVIIPSCIRPDKNADSEEVKSKVKEIRNKYKDKTICFAVGRHVPYKGMEYLIKASDYLDDSFVVLIGGKGELTDSLKEMAKNDKKVHFLGRIPDNEMAAYYKSCDIFCFPSITKNEAFGLSLAEAMYYGKPNVTFTVPGSGINFVSLNGITGIECPNKDVLSYSKAIKKLGSDKVLRNKLGKASLERCKNNFLLEQFEPKIKELILNI